MLPSILSESLRSLSSSSIFCRSRSMYFSFIFTTLSIFFFWAAFSLYSFLTRVTASTADTGLFSFGVALSWKHNQNFESSLVQFNQSHGQNNTMKLKWGFQFEHCCRSNLNQNSESGLKNSHNACSSRRITVCFTHAGLSKLCNISALALSSHKLPAYSESSQSDKQILWVLTNTGLLPAGLLVW